MAATPKNGKKAAAGQMTSDQLMVRYLLATVVFALGVLLFLSVALDMQGTVFAGARLVCNGLAGGLAIVLPFVPMWGGAVIFLTTRTAATGRKQAALFGLSTLAYLLVLTLIDLAASTGSPATPLMTYILRLNQSKSYVTTPDSLESFLAQGYAIGSATRMGGGLLGMLLAWPLWKLTGGVTVGIIVSVVLLLTVIGLIFRTPLKKLFGHLRSKGDAAKQAAQQEQRALTARELGYQREQEQLRAARAQQAAPTYPPQPRPVRYPAEQGVYPQDAYPVQGGYGYPDPSVSPSPYPPQTANQYPNAPRVGGFAAGESDDRYAVVDSGYLYQEQASPDVLTEQADVGKRPKKSKIFGRGRKKDAEPAQETPNEPFPESGYADSANGGQEPYAPPQYGNGYAPQNEPATPYGNTPQYGNGYAPQEEPATPYGNTPQYGNGYAPQEEPATPYGNTPQYGNGYAPQDEPATPYGNAPQYGNGYAAQEEPATPYAPPRKDAHEPANAATYGSVARSRGTADYDSPSAELVEDTTPNDADRPPWEEPPTVEETPITRRLRRMQEAAPIEAEPASKPESPAAGKRPATSSPLRVPVVQSEPQPYWEPDLKIPYKKEAEEAETPTTPPYVFPLPSLLQTPKPPNADGAAEDALRSRRLEDTLQSFKIPAKVRHVTHGPAISRFELEMAAGIKVNKVTELDRNIAMNMEVKSVRIEAPIPGKSLVGVEVPNKKVQAVTLREVLETTEMRDMKSPLGVALGKDIAGLPIVCDLARMPHLLIAGATGSGKSVCVNAMINSILYRATPDEVRLILVDPKVVELQCYNGIPHLLIPVVSDPHKAAGALSWAVSEMMERYQKFTDAGVREITGYNAKLGEGEKPMPRILIVIDELADLMMSCKKEVEEYICRLAQLARAAGIHLVVATQRPSVDVITGLIKANIPSRIAFKVSSNVDSRTILDRNGAEKLLGYGDMLYLPNGEFTPIRVQGCFLTDAEVNRITDFIRTNSHVEYDPDILEAVEKSGQDDEEEIGADAADSTNNADGVDPLLEQAIEMAVMDGQTSISMLQRRLRIGYARAGRLIDDMTRRGIISTASGAKPRQVLISRESFESMKFDD